MLPLRSTGQRRLLLVSSEQEWAWKPRRRAFVVGSVGEQMLLVASVGGRATLLGSGRGQILLLGSPGVRVLLLAGPALFLGGPVLSGCVAHLARG